MKNMETAYRAIQNPEGTIELHDLYKDDGSFSYEPCLEFKNVEFDNYWDNSKYLLDLFKQLKSGKTKEFKHFCIENNLDYKSTKKQLLSIYKTSKHLNFWNGKNRTE